MKEVAVVGGGAAGCFFAAVLAGLRPDLHICVYEAGARPMAKLAVTGGGRCNITNTFEGVESLAEVYPRGDKLMRKALGRFGWKDTCRWFEDRGVKFVTQEDHCIFPASQDAMQIVHTLEREMRRGGVELRCSCKVKSINELLQSGTVILTTGGGTAGILEGTGIDLVQSVPSLFTFKIACPDLHELMGTVVKNASLGLAGTRFRSRGTLLLTDWGVSGPATLKLSSYAARHLAENGYKGTLLVDWLGGGEVSAREVVDTVSGAGSRMVANSHPAQLSDRLWRHLVARARIREDCRWAEMGSKGLARLINVLSADSYDISGRARFKEEFVTCGGVALTEVNPATMESRKLPGLYFAGEVLDIDAVTGGFNLQAAWSTAWVAAQAVAKTLQSQ